jgi:tetratricopeptide (TPR) repeat protein
LLSRFVLSSLLVFILLALLGSAHAEAFRQVRELIEAGYYASVAQVEGPALVNEYPDDPQAHYLYSLALYLSGEVTQARAALERALTLVGEEAPAHFDWLHGLLYAAAGELATAEALLAEAFAKSGDYRIGMDWARIAWQHGEFETALRAFTAAGETERGQLEPWPHLQRGRLLLLLGRHQEAIDAFERAISIVEALDVDSDHLPSPAYSEAFYRLGLAYEALGELRQAEIHFEAALSVDPGHIPALRALERLQARP